MFVDESGVTKWMDVLINVLNKTHKKKKNCIDCKLK